MTKIIAVSLCVLCGALARPSFLRRKNNCPKVEPINDLNLTEYTRATWYIQQQQLTGYQPENSLYCTTATYDVEGQKVPLFGGEVVSVFNYGNIDEVNGKAQNSDNSTLCARVPESSEPAKLLVAPCFLPNLLAGDYWVVAAGPSSQNYEWAIVSGGQPSEQFADGCTTKQTGTNGAGFWLFSRAPVASSATLKTLRSTAKELGYTLDFLKEVKHEGCQYKGAFIKK